MKQELYKTHGHDSYYRAASQTPHLVSSGPLFSPQTEQVQVPGATACGLKPAADQLKPEAGWAGGATVAGRASVVVPALEPGASAPQTVHLSVTEAGLVSIQSGQVHVPAAGFVKAKPLAAQLLAVAG